MEVELIDKNQNRIKAFISKVGAVKLKVLTSSWKFDWSLREKSKKTQIYKVDSGEIEGLLKIEFFEEGYFVMNMIEVSPQNYGSKGKIVNVAEVLISYACLLAFKLNEGPYKGYLTFTSKGKLIDYYINKYDAELIFRDRMIISPNKGLELIEEHLKLKL